MINNDYDILITQKDIDEYATKFGLKKALLGIHLWGFGVGSAIGGTFFEWNYGLEESGVLGFLIATLIVTVFYIVLASILNELSISLPYSGGPYAYARKGLGAFWGFLAGSFTILEFLCASSAIAISIGSYVEHMNPSIPKNYVIIIIYAISLLIHIIGIKQSAIIQLIITSTAISALIIFFIGTVSSIDLQILLNQKHFVNGYKGILTAMPFAIWFYLCIEGIILAAEETKNPKKSISLGFVSSISTVAFLNIGVLLVCFSTVNWEILSNSQYPLSNVLIRVQPNDKVALMVFTTLALSGLLASLHGIVNGFSRQVYALSRSGYIPTFLSKLHPITKTPYLSILIPGIIAIILAFKVNAKYLLFLAVFSALFMYIIVIFSYIFIKYDEYKNCTKKKPKILRLIFLLLLISILLIVCFVFIKESQIILNIAFFFLMVVLYYGFIGKKFIICDTPEEVKARSEKIEVN